MYWFLYSTINLILVCITLVVCWFLCHGCAVPYLASVLLPNVYHVTLYCTLPASMCSKVLLS